MCANLSPQPRLTCWLVARSWCTIMLLHEACGGWRKRCARQAACSFGDAKLKVAPASLTDQASLSLRFFAFPTRSAPTDRPAARSAARKIWGRNAPTNRPAPAAGPGRRAASERPDRPTRPKAGRRTGPCRTEHTCPPLPPFLAYLRPTCHATCAHGRQRSRCKDCGGRSICEHGRLRYRCKECGGKPGRAH